MITEFEDMPRPDYTSWYEALLDANTRSKIIAHKHYINICGVGTYINSLDQNTTGLTNLFI